MPGSIHPIPPTPPAQLPPPSASAYDWQRARARLEEAIEKQLLVDREIGRAPANLTLDKIRRIAREKAERACERAIRTT